MKGALLLAAAILASALVLGQSTIRAQPAQTGSVEQIITQLEQDWATAYVNKDAATLEKIMAQELLWSGPEGEIENGAQGIQEVRTGAYTCTAAHIDEIKVKVYGDAAIVFGLETEKSTFKGQDSSGQYRFTDVFVKRNGVWQAVASHTSKVVKH